MSLLWFDSFGTYNTFLEPIKINKLYANSGCYFYASGGRGDRGYYRGSHGTDFKIDISDVNPTTVICGWALYIDSSTVPGYQASYPLIRFMDRFARDTSYTGSHIYVYINSSRYFEVRNYSNTILGTGTTPIQPYTWYHIQMKVYIHDSNGTVEIRVEGETDVDLSSIDTCNGSNAYVACVDLRGLHSYIQTWWSDFWLVDLSGSHNNDWLGDRRVDCIRPNANGTHNDFASHDEGDSSGAAGDYTNVDENYSNLDTDYDYADDVGSKISYNMEPLDVLGAEINAIKTIATVRREGVGYKKTKTFNIINSVEDSGDEFTLLGSYTTDIKMDELNPNDSSAFDENDIASIEAGIEITE